jgi:hypothetical protein
VFEKLLEFDLDLMSLNDSMRSSLPLILIGAGLLIEVLEIESPSSNMFLILLLGIKPRESS